MREVVGLFNTMEQLQGAVKELERTEFPRDALSVLAEHKSLNGIKDMENLEDDESVARQAPVRSEEKTIGAGVLISSTAYLGAMAVALAAGAVTVPAILTAAAIGGTGGAAAGGILAKVLGDHFHHDIEDQIKKGGLLLWVRTNDEEKERLAHDILSNYGADHIKVLDH